MSFGFFFASFDFSLLWPVLAELITRFARYGFASEFQVYSQIVAWFVLARVSGASEAHSVLNFGYVSKFWVCLHISGFFSSSSLLGSFAIFWFVKEF